jgi:hypothetical protein
MIQIRTVNTSKSGCLDSVETIFLAIRLRLAELMPRQPRRGFSYFHKGRSDFVLLNSQGAVGF